MWISTFAACKWRVWFVDKLWKICEFEIYTFHYFKKSVEYCLEMLKSERGG